MENKTICKIWSIIFLSLSALCVWYFIYMQNNPDYTIDDCLDKFDCSFDNITVYCSDMYWNCEENYTPLNGYHHAMSILCLFGAVFGFAISIFCCVISC
jgi:hypothetical protein